MSGATDHTPTLGQWLARLRARSALAPASLAALAGVTPRTLLKWERGHTHPDGLRLRRLLAILAAQGSCTHVEAAALWEQANRESKRRLGPFDGAWFDLLLASRAAPPASGGGIGGPASGPPRAPVAPVAPWGQAPEAATLPGRDAERDQGASREPAALTEHDVRGLAEAACRMSLAGRQLSGANAEWATLARQHSGDPLALKLVAEAILDQSGASIGSFLSRQAALFEGVRALIEQHMSRLNALELELLTRLAIAREPIAAIELMATTSQPITYPRLLEALEGLRRRNLVERGVLDFSLLPIVMEYVTEWLVEQAHTEIVAGDLHVIRSHALLQAAAPEHVRRSQLGAIIRPLLNRLADATGSSHVLITRLRQILTVARALPPAQQGYAEANLLNLLSAAEQDAYPVVDDPATSGQRAAPTL